MSEPTWISVAWRAVRSIVAVVGLSGCSGPAHAPESLSSSTPPTQEQGVEEDAPPERVRWEFEGHWQGEGQVSFAPTARGVAIEGFESVSFRPLRALAPLAERLFLARRFESVWESGWRRLRRQAATRAGPPR